MTPTKFTQDRESLGLTQHDLAEAFGVSIRTISAIENGDDVPVRYALAMVGLMAKQRKVMK